MIAPHIERIAVPWPNWENRFNANSEVRHIVKAPTVPEPIRGDGGFNAIPVSPATNFSQKRKDGRGRPTVSNEPCINDGKHFWVSKGPQVRCTNCNRNVLKTLLPADAIINVSNAPTSKGPCRGPDTPCPQSAMGHKWLSKGAGHVRCSLCRKTWKKVTLSTTDRLKAGGL